MEPSSPPPLGHLVAALSARADVESLTAVLTETLAGMLPPSMIDVDRDRSVSDRMHGRPGRPVGLTVRAGEHELILRRTERGSHAEIAHVVRGVVLSRRPATLPEWIGALAVVIHDQAATDDAARDALNRLLLG